MTTRAPAVLKKGMKGKERQKVFFMYIRKVEEMARIKLLSLLLLKETSPPPSPRWSSAVQGLRGDHFHFPSAQPGKEGF